MALPIIAQLIIVGVVFATFLFGIIYLVDFISKKSVDSMFSRYAIERAKYHVDQIITLKEDYFGDEVVIRKGRVGRITELDPKYLIAIVDFGNIELTINLMTLGRHI